MNQAFKDGILISLSVGKWGGAKKLDASDLNLTPEQIPDFMRLGRKLLIPQEERNVFAQIENNARNVLERDSFAFPVGQARFVPRNRILQIDAALIGFRVQYEAAIESFIDRYQLIREEMLNRYPDYRERLEPFYPPTHQIRRLFYFRWSAFEIGETNIREGETAEAYQRFKDNLQAQFDGFLNDVVLDMRFQVQETCLHVAERIGKGDIINGNSVKSLNGMIDKFMSLNFIGDAKIETQLHSLKATLQTIDTADLKESAALRNQLGVMAASIAKEAADISDISEITHTYKRKIEMD